VAEFSEEWIQLKIREELGFDNVNLFKDEVDEATIMSRNEFEKELTLGDRHDKA